MYFIIIVVQAKEKIGALVWNLMNIVSFYCRELPLPPPPVHPYYTSYFRYPSFSSPNDFTWGGYGYGGGRGGMKGKKWGRWKEEVWGGDTVCGWIFSVWIIGFIENLWECWTSAFPLPTFCQPHHLDSNTFTTFELCRGGMLPPPSPPLKRLGGGVTPFTPTHTQKLYAFVSSHENGDICRFVVFVGNFI